MKSAEEKLRKVLCLEDAGGDINYSVIAGAGAGKSTMLSKRISRQIKAGENLESFVIITYTNAAANELRDKITDELVEMLADASLTAAERANVENAVERIELVQISTIHSFLLQILRENAFESKLALDAEMLEDDKESERRKAFFDNWIKTHFKDLEDFRADWTIKKENGFSTDYTRDVVWRMFSDIASLRENIVVDTSDHSAEFEQAAKKYVDQHLPAFKAFKNEVINNCPKKKDGTPKMIKDVAAIVDSITAAEGSVDAGNYGKEDAIRISDAYTSLIKRVKAKKEDESQGFYGKNTDDSMLDGLYPEIPRDELLWNFRKYYEDYMLWSQKAAKVAGYAVKIRDAYQAETDADARAISNDDILYRAERLLTGYPQILKALREKYTRIYVDEFQDTTGCQARIVRLLSGKDGSSLSPFDPKENNLLVVGDPKQSIYRFTGAEKAVYDEVNREIGALSPTLGQAVTLDYNFRSNEDIVKWVNSKYAKLMPAYTPMDSDWIVKDKKALHGVFRRDPFALNGTGKYTKESDAESVTSLIKALVSGDCFFLEEYDHKRKTYASRRLRYSDFMVITRNATDMLVYVTQFNKDGIPLNVQGKFRLESDEVVRNFIRILAYFADSKNGNVRFAASQIAGRINASKFDVSGLKAGEIKLRALKDEFVESGAGTSAIVYRLLKEEDLYLPDGSFDVLRVKEYKSRLYQMAEACLAENNGDISELVLTMLSYVSREIKKANPLESEEDAVRLMNVHQAKGLTGNIVIIADRRNDEAPRYSGFKSMGNYYPAASYSPSEISSPKIFPAFAFDDALMKKASREEWEEKTRLEYVASTRAAHALIFLPVVGDGKGVINNNIWFTEPEYGLDVLPEIDQWMNDRRNDASSHIAAAGAGGRNVIKLADLDENMAKVDLALINSEVIDSITPSGLEPAGLTGFTPADSGYAEDKRPRGDVFGTVMHRTYELIFSRFADIRSLEKTARDKAVRRIINQAISEQLDEMHSDDNPADFASYLENKMEDYYSKVVLPIMDSAEEVYPEFTFSFFVPDSEVDSFKKRFESILDAAGRKRFKTDSIWINGQADLVVKTKDGNVKVYDYKSDSRNGKPMTDFENSLKAKYSGQLELYKYAIGKAFGVSNVDAEIIHLYL